LFFLFQFKIFLVLFWSLLESSRIFVGDLSPPICNKFDPNKMEEVNFF